MSIDVARWLREAREVLASTHGPVTGPVVVTVRDRETGNRVAFQVGGDVSPVERTAALSPLERDVVRIIQDARGPVTAKVIAARLRIRADAGLYAILRNLTEREPPVLVSGPHGYTLVQGDP